MGIKNLKLKQKTQKWSDNLQPKPNSMSSSRKKNWWLLILQQPGAHHAKESLLNSQNLPIKRKGKPSSSRSTLMLTRIPLKHAESKLCQLSNSTREVRRSTRSEVPTMANSSPRSRSSSEQK